mgnify:CR=1 FL=1
MTLLDRLKKTPPVTSKVKTSKTSDTFEDNKPENQGGKLKLGKGGSGHNSKTPYSDVFK